MNILTTAVANAIKLEQLRIAHGAAFVDQVLQMHRETPWPLDACYERTLMLSKP